MTHTVLSPSTIGAPSCPISLESRLGGVVDLLTVWRRRAVSRRQLLAMDDRMLHDIGLDRVTAWDEARKPFWMA
ncbi:DUF1127 domain-containing protein [Rhodospira trueperi]|uniref:YjiS-like domain-containing protein n=1 Tax=Rhodospira trueperi TaxID=69960 RepID=A0A1G7FDS2_9PROT|nr:DUF1127 domain-containing protein [Rhodospira trueperi]SDE73735.1 protein of unknown function [Rhodospira trueperi]